MKTESGPPPSAPTGDTAAGDAAGDTAAGDTAGDSPTQADHANSGEGSATEPPTVVVNPPPPEREQPKVIVNPPPPRPRPDREVPAAPPSGGEVRQRADGTCWWYADPPDCQPSMTCNPPRPYEVQCPAEDSGRAPDPAK